jgi:hypothetical protein
LNTQAVADDVAQAAAKWYVLLHQLLADRYQQTAALLGGAISRRPPPPALALFMRCACHIRLQSKAGWKVWHFVLLCVALQFCFELLHYRRLPSPSLGAVRATYGFRAKLDGKSGTLYCGSMLGTTTKLLSLFMKPAFMLRLPLLKSRFCLPVSTCAMSGVKMDKVQWGIE